MIGADHRSGNKLIGLACGQSRLHHRGGSQPTRAAPLHHGVIGRFNPFPAVVAVHRVIAADHRGDTGPGGQPGLQLRQKHRGRCRGHIAAIGDRMNGDRHACGHNRPGGGQHMRDMAMHPAAGNHPHQMRHPARGLQRMDKPDQCGICRKRAILDRQINRAQIHRHHPARADIGMAHLGIAHLPGGQTDIRAMGDQFRIGTSGHQMVEMGHMRQRGGIGKRIGAFAPAIQNAQDHRFHLAHLTFPTCVGRLLDQQDSKNHSCMSLGLKYPRRRLLGPVIRPARQY